MLFRSLNFVSVALTVSVFGQQQIPLLAVDPPILRITPDEWKALNTSIGGRLFSGAPLAMPCYNNFNGEPKEPDVGLCKDVQKARYKVDYLTAQMAGYVHGNWGTCQRTSKGCPTLSNSKPTAPCNQGNIPNYYIDVRQISHIKEGLAFASQHGIPIVVKNSGHDYMGRSSGPNSLALWMNNYKSSIKLTKGFTPEGCSEPAGDIVTFGAGEDFLGLFEFAEKNQVTVVGGSSESVRPAGGWITGGGHSPLSPVYGLSVDNVKQLKVVLPSGKLVVANRCQNQDIFFALRGGGGGTFGVNVEMSVVAHPKTTIQWASFTLPNADRQKVDELLALLIANSNRWHREGWGGYFWPLGFGTAQIQLLNPRMDAKQATESLQPLIDLVKLRSGTQNIKTYPSFYPLFSENFKGKVNDIGGTGNAMATRMIPRSSFEGATNRSKLVKLIADALVDPKKYRSFIMICLVAPNINIKDDDSSITPTWRDALWQVTSVARWRWAETVAAGDTNTVTGAFKAVHDAMAGIRDFTPGSGSYINEADLFEPNPTEAFWGKTNYERLLKVKKQVDPKNIMQVYNGVGWDRSADLFSCYPEYS